LLPLRHPTGLLPPNVPLDTLRIIIEPLYLRVPSIGTFISLIVIASFEYKNEKN